MEVMWQLRYASGGVQDEPSEGGSIRNARPGAVQLVLTEKLYEGGIELRRAWQRVELTDDGSGLVARPWLPIFYRQRYGEMNGRAARADGTGHLGAVVFGRGREGSDAHFDTQLWCWQPGMGHGTRDCPPALIAQKTIETQLTEPTG